MGEDWATVDLADLAGMKLLLPPPGTAFRDELDTACAGAGFSVMPRAEIDGVRLIATLVFEGYGPAVLPASALPPWLQGDWTALAVRGLPRRRVGLAVRRRGLPSAPVRAVTEVLREVADPLVAAVPGLWAPTGTHNRVLSVPDPGAR